MTQNICHTAAIYIRVSTDKQEELSPDAQKRLLIAYAKNNKYIISEDNIFMENGISGKKADKRPQFQRMIALAKQTPKPFDAILVWKFSRFARNQEESIVYKSLLRKQYNIDIISISEPLIDGPFGSLIERIIEWMDEYYSIRLSGEVMRGMTEKALRGGCQSKPPFGYNMSASGIPEINPEEKEIVKTIFELFASEKSSYYIAKHLNSLGFRTRKNNLFSKKSIDYILSNPFYNGIVKWNCRQSSTGELKDKNEWIEVKGVHELFISNELFEKVQKRYQKLHSVPKSSGAKTTKPSENYKHYLSGIMYCSNCSSVLVSSSGNLVNGKRYRTFQCRSYNTGQCNKSHSISAAKAENAIKDSLYEFTQSAAAAFEKKLPANIGIDINALKAALTKLEQKEQRIKNAYINEIDTLDEYKENKTAILAEKEKVRLELAKSESFNSEITEQDRERMRKKAANVLDIINSESISIPDKSDAIKNIIDKITYHKDTGDFEVFYFLQ